MEVVMGTQQEGLIPCASSSQEAVYVEMNGRVGQLYYNPTTQEQVVQFLEFPENVSLELPDNVDTPESANQGNEGQGEIDMSEVIWANNRKRSLPIDHQATEAFLILVGSAKYQAMMNDKKTTKKYVYQLIGKEMAAKGFNFGTASVIEMGEKCDQKWRNLEKKYQDHNKKVVYQTGGAGGLKEPPYYEMIHSIIGTRHANAPVRILQSSCPAEGEAAAGGTSKSPVPSATTARRPLKEMRAEKRKALEAEENKQNEEEEDDVIAPSSPFLSVKSSTKPERKKILNSDIVKKMEEFHAEEMEAQKEQFKKFSKYMKVTTKQRGQLIKIFGQAFSSTSNGKNVIQQNESSESSSDTESSEDEQREKRKTKKLNKMKGKRD